MQLARGLRVVRGRRPVPHGHLVLPGRATTFGAQQIVFSFQPLFLAKASSQFNLSSNDR